MMTFIFIGKRGFVRVLLILCLLSAGAACADVLRGMVVGVHDGDTITVWNGQANERIRLSGIDAPETKQPFGAVSKRNLSDLVFGKEVDVEWSKRDRYKRIVGKVMIAGKDACLEQIRAGVAWWYREYAKEQPVADRRSYEDAENSAKSQRRGLWVDADPTAPWDWRHAKRR
ncbi:thermonuclease family protein [Uliginosibacterium sp. 31-16]|uniref:thermonuclease family protein n=1 Tax=Uliginosibacterium sp. 31-16 TaxID=3068315 RepID=UPI00273F329B|nr:thermonuclease family protein [Uliginosibacterium sp. 31-16]MDP5239938.1 thermonuclease family protein [Uliginosibacterium sp. 31-16]